MSKEIVSIHKKIINPLKYSKKEREPAQKEHLYPFLFLNLTSCKNYRIMSRFIPWLWRHFYTRVLAVSQVISTIVCYCISPKHLIFMGHKVVLWASLCVLLIFLVGIFLRWHFFICAVQMARTKCPTSRTQTLCITIICGKRQHKD